MPNYNELLKYKIIFSGFLCEILLCVPSISKKCNKCSIHSEVSSKTRTYSVISKLATYSVRNPTVNIVSRLLYVLVEKSV